MNQQSCCSSVGRAIGWDLKDSDLIHSPGEFFPFISFIRGNEPNGEQQEQEQQQQLK